MQLQESPWNENRIAELRKYFEAGFSCSQIGREIGATRNSVIGKLHRLGLSRPRDPVEKKAAKPRKGYSSTIRFRKPKPLPQREYEAVERSPKNKTLLELQDGECKWPIGHEAPYLFCATDAVKGLPYCGYHARKAYSNAGFGWKRPDRTNSFVRMNGGSSRALERSMDREDGAAR